MESRFDQQQLKSVSLQIKIRFVKKYVLELIYKNSVNVNSQIPDKEVNWRDDRGGEEVQGLQLASERPPRTSWGRQMQEADG